MKSHKSWTWIPSLYFAEGLPYVAVMTVSVIMYKKLGISNTDIAYYTGWLYLPWVIKPLWSPFVDLIKTKRWWIYTMQLLIGAGLAGVAYTIPTSMFFQTTLAFFWLIAFSSATHDIAADGFYLLGLKPDKQAFFIGIRNLFYRFALITGQGLLIFLAGRLEKYTGRIPYSWSIIFFIFAGVLLSMGLWHRYILPSPAEDTYRSEVNVKSILSEFLKTFVAFFQKEGIIVALLFLLTFRLGEAQLLKMVSPFMLDSREDGGLMLSTEQVGFAYGTLGIIALAIGGILGGIVISKYGGLKAWLLPMTLAIFIPNLAYLYLAMLQPGNIWIIYGCITVEQFGYGFGFTAYTMYMMLFSKGKYKTSHYAICTAFMALGMMLPGMASGWIQEHVGYINFFIWIMISGLPVFFVLPFIKYNNRKKTMKYYECSFTYSFTSGNKDEMMEIVNDVLAAETGEIGFESFVETEDGLNAYIPENIYNAGLLREKLQSFPMEGVEISFKEQLMDDRNWNEEWEKNYFKPIAIGNECIIHASFHTVETGYKYDIVIDPKMSFGTGNHETTSLMLEELLKLDLSGKAVLDMGCGTGILSILAARRGASRIAAVDIDEWAYENSKENASTNHVNIEVYHGDAGLIPQLGMFDIVLANINRNILLNDICHYAEALKPEGLFLASGFYTEDIPVISEECIKNGISILSISEKNLWASIKGIRNNVR